MKAVSGNRHRKTAALLWSCVALALAAPALAAARYEFPVIYPDGTYRTATANETPQGRIVMCSHVDNAPQMKCLLRTAEGKYVFVPLTSPFGKQQT